MNVLIAKTPIYTKGPTGNDRPGQIGDKLYTTMTNESNSTCYCLVQYLMKNETDQYDIVSEIYSDATCGLGTEGCNTEGTPLFRILVSYKEDIMMLVDLKACSTYSDYMQYCSMHGIEPINDSHFAELSKICEVPALLALMFGPEQMKYLTYWVEQLPSLHVDNQTLAAFENRQKRTDKSGEEYSGIAAAMRKIFYSYYSKAPLEESVETT